MPSIKKNIKKSSYFHLKNISTLTIKERLCWNSFDGKTNDKQYKILQKSLKLLPIKVDESRGEGVKTSISNASSMDWDFSEDRAFLALCDAFRESGEASPMEFLATGEGAFHFQELTQNAAGEGFDLSDSESMAEFQIEVLEAMDVNNS